MARLGNITFACFDPASLAEFWAEALEYEIQPPPPGVIEAIEAAGGDTNAAAAAIDPRGDGPRLYFRRGPNPPLITFPFTSISKLLIAKLRLNGSSS